MSFETRYDGAMILITRKRGRRLFMPTLVVVAGALTFTTGLRLSGQEDARHLFSQANIQLDRGHFAEAVTGYDRCLAADPHFARAYFNRALANEMVDRAKALEDWKRFIEAAGNDPALKWDAAKAQARVQLLERMPAIPEGLSPAHYVADAGDYYRQIAADSDGLQWREYPVKVSLGNAPDIKWQQGTREAYNIWAAVFPTQLVAVRDEADIRIDWEESVRGAGHGGEEMDWVQFKRVGNQLSGQRIAVITVDLSHPWSKDEMRAIMVHEFGHALGIKGHSDSKKDIMFFQMQEGGGRRIVVAGVPSPVFWKFLVKDPSQRDMNTLLRLYNSAGDIALLR
jgi:predicted Zn-dependent protease